MPVKMAKKVQKPTTFAQIIEQEERMDKAYERYEKANDKYHALIDKFPDCYRKLMKHNGKVYLVSCSKMSCSEKKQINYFEVEDE